MEAYAVLKEKLMTMEIVRIPAHPKGQPMLLESVVNVNYSKFMLVVFAVQKVKSMIWAFVKITAHLKDPTFWQEFVVNVI